MNAKDLTKKKVRNALGGAALAVGLILGGASALPAITHAQTAPTSAAASQTTPAANQTTPAASSQTAAPSQGQNNQTAPTQDDNGGPGSGFDGNGGPGGRGGNGGPGDNGFGGHGGHGGPGGRGGPGGGLSGVISSVSGNTITLKQANSIVITATVSSSTTYSEAGKTITEADLKVGETVALHESRNTDGTVNVAQVEVVLNHAGGSISAISGNSLTLTRADGSTTKVNVDASTTYQDLGQSSNLSALKTGIKVDVAGMLGSDGSLNAQVVNIQHDHLGGTVTAISGNTITVQGGGGPGRDGNGKGPRPGGAANGSTSTATAAAATATTRTITVSSDTSYLTAGQASQLSNIKVGDQIEAAGTLSSDGNSLTALQVTVRLPDYRGQVTAVNGNTITLQDRGTTRTVEVTSSTKYLNGTTSAALSDVKAGVNIEAQGQLDASGKLTATTIQLGQPQQPHK